MRSGKVKRLGLAVLVGVCGTGALIAENVPLSNWKVPRGGVTPQADITPGVAFVAMEPCRIVDTRGPAGPYGGPALVAGVPRDFDLDNGPCTGIPAGVESYSLNVTATQTQGPGDLRIYPAGSPQPLVSTLNYVANETVANAAIVPAGAGAAISVIAAVSGTHLIIDINGYFTDEYNTNVGFQAIGTNSSQMGLFQNNSTAALTYGLLGRSLSTANRSAGVKGVEGSGEPAFASASEPTSGVLGLSDNDIGVYGISERVGVEGHLHGSAGQELAIGRLGYFIAGSPSVNYAVYAQGDAHVTGTLTATIKSFVEPHRTDASKEIRYISVEAPTAEVYFRGTSQVSNGFTRIEVPEHFRQVARPGSYSTMITPVGSMATVGVVSEDESGIVIRASRNVKVHYVVHAERDAFKDHNPITKNVHFRPSSAEGFGRSLPESYREILIQNGTLGPDGRVNLTTATRLGWDKEWAQEKEAHHTEKER